MDTIRDNSAICSKHVLAPFPTIHLLSLFSPKFQRSQTFVDLVVQTLQGFRLGTVRPRNYDFHHVDGQIMSSLYFNAGLWGMSPSIFSKLRCQVFSRPDGERDVLDLRVHRQPQLKSKPVPCGEPNNEPQFDMISIEHTMVNLGVIYFLPLTIWLQENGYIDRSMCSILSKRIQLKSQTFLLGRT